MALNRISGFDELPDSALLSAREIAGVIGISEKTVWRWVGNFLPKPQRISARCTRWPVGEVRKALAQKSGN
jgi:predicted DNA-binding transcriptional regulator AlpA